MIVPGFTVLAIPCFFHAEQSRTMRGITAVNVHGNGPTPARSDNDLGLVLIELGLGDADGFLHVVVR
jgi:hypothetical protein